MDSVRASLEQTANLAVLVQAAESSREAVFIFSSDARQVDCGIACLFL